MATSEVEISNRALGRIGVDTLIESLDDPNARARQCKLQYDPCRQEVLQDFPWNFAQTSVALALVADVEVAGWRYVYRYPASCLKVHRVTGPEGMRVMSALSWSSDFCNYNLLIPNKLPFAVMNDPLNEGAKIICTDVETASAWFTADVDVPAQFTALFRSALSWRMAMELALSLKAAPALYNTAAQQYGWAVSQAQVQSLGEQTTDPMPNSPAVQARF